MAMNPAGDSGTIFAVFPLVVGISFVIFFSLNLLIWNQKSSGAVPFGTLFALCFLWFGISVPLVFVGSYFGYKKAAPEDPVRTNKIPRQIPEQPWWVEQEKHLLCPKLIRHTSSTG